MTLNVAVAALLAAGVQVEHVFTDRGTSAPAAHRAAWREMVADLHRGDVVVSLSLAGVARSHAELHRLICDVDPHGC